MFVVSRTFTARAPAATVLAYLEDWGNSPDWDPATITCTKATNGPVEVGTEWRNVVRLLRRRVLIAFRLDHADGDQLVFTGWNRGATATDTITCTALDAGRTSITYHSHVVLHRTARLAAPLLRRDLKRIGDELVEQMTTVLNNRT